MNSPGTAERKEFVLDVDLTDYDSIRRCCSGADVCVKCWVFAEIAIEYLSRVMREEFGFEKFIWVFSGRRGIHCWVSDRCALDMDNEKRSVLVDYLNIFDSDGNIDYFSQNNQNSVGNATKNAYDTSKLLHPTHEKFVKIAKRRFLDSILPHQILANDVGTEHFLSKIPCQELRNRISEKIRTYNLYEEDPTEEKAILRAHSFWNDLEQNILPSYFKCQKSRPCSTAILKELILYFSYPRLDINVSKALNHLLKLPFCVHPSTGSICIPINHNNLETFSLIDVPNLKSFFEPEFPDEANSGGDKENSAGLQRFNASLKYFNKFLDSL
ncbi:MAG: hypothetical protein MHMPM18_003206 [Marteilia pararefringens]